MTMNILACEKCGELIGFDLEVFDDGERAVFTARDR